jgi:hypothetical protein
MSPAAIHPERFQARQVSYRVWEVFDHERAEPLKEYWQRNRKQRACSHAERLNKLDREWGKENNQPAEGEETG